MVLIFLGKFVVSEFQLSASCETYCVCYNFSISRDKPTLVPKLRVPIGQRAGLSRTDCYKVNHLYGCFDKSPYEKIKYESLCDIMGL